MACARPPARTLRWPSCSADYSWGSSTMNARSFGGSELRSTAEAAEAALTAMKISERQAQIIGAEVRPQRVDEAELGVGRLPKQEVRQPLLAAGADEEVDVM